MKSIRFLASTWPSQKTSEAELAQVAHALGTDGAGLRLPECRKQHACKDRDDGDHDEQFDEGESLSG
jgi:hypothetical protein